MKTILPLLNRQFQIMRKMRNSDGQGGWLESWAIIAVNPGRLSPIGTTERVVAAQSQAVITHTFYCLESEDILRGDQIRSGNTLVEAIGVQRTSEPGNHLQVSCREIQLEEQEVIS
jgi:head-tail adaptor